MGIKSGVKNLDRLIVKLGKMEGLVLNELQKSMDKQVQTVQATAKSIVPRNEGELGGSIYKKVEIQGKSIVGIVYTNKEYAKYVEFGTGQPGQATNKNPNVNVSYKLTKWKGNIPGVGWRYIAGQPAQPFLYPALEENKHKIRKRLRADIRKALADITIK